MPASNAAAAGPGAPVAARAEVTAALHLFAQEPGGLLPALHHIQDALGYVPADAVPHLATAFNLSRAEVHGVITYYHHFRSEPPGRHVVQVCRAEACQAMGADALMAHAQRSLGCTAHHASHGQGQIAAAAAPASGSTAAPGGHSPDGRFTLEPVYCLGLCASSPAAMVGSRVHARLTPEKFDRIIAALGEEV